MTTKITQKTIDSVSVHAANTCFYDHVLLYKYGDGSVELRKSTRSKWRSQSELLTKAHLDDFEAIYSQARQSIVELRKLINSGDIALGGRMKKEKTTSKFDEFSFQMGLVLGGLSNDEIINETLLRGSSLRQLSECQTHLMSLAETIFYRSSNPKK